MPGYPHSPPPPRHFTSTKEMTSNLLYVIFSLCFCSLSFDFSVFLLFQTLRQSLSESKGLIFCSSNFIFRASVFFFILYFFPTISVTMNNTIHSVISHHLNIWLEMRTEEIVISSTVILLKFL